MRNPSMLVLLFVFAVIAACGPMPKTSEYIKKDFSPDVYADESHALIYFMRETPIVNLGAGDYILEDGKRIGVMLGGTFFVRKLTPGKYSFWADSITPTILTMNVKAGEVYYVEGVPRNPSLELREITKTVADKLMVGMKYIELVHNK